jgi:hypothetical protein
MYRIQVLDAAVRELAQLDKTVARRIAGRINWLAANVEAIPSRGAKGASQNKVSISIPVFRRLDGLDNG